MAKYVRNKYDDEAERFLESLQNVPDQSDPAEPLDEALEKIDENDTRRHCSMVTILTLAFIMIFFGTSLLALTNKQDFTDDEHFSAKALMSGKYLSHAEKQFDSSIPLRDYLHNVESALRYCFGVGNTTDYIDIQAKLRSEDPYNVETYDNYVPVDDSQTPIQGVVPDETREAADTGEETETAYSDDGMNKKLKSITLSVTTTTKADDSSSSEQSETTTTNNSEPGATTTTTIPPETTTTTRRTRVTRAPVTTTTAAETSETTQETSETTEPVVDPQPDDSGTAPE